MSLVLDRLPVRSGVPAERPLWRMRRPGQTATAFERVYSDHIEVRIHIGAQLAFHRSFTQLQPARDCANAFRTQFERQGWTCEASLVSPDMDPRR